jgi:hypothetical protein
MLREVVDGVDGFTEGQVASLAAFFLTDKEDLA